MNRVLFYSDKNEINIFVEDEGKEFEYEHIFERLFSREIKIDKIFPMKGKEGVKKAFDEFGVESEGKIAIYLVDGDFDLILEKDMVNHPQFIYLDKYNIESYYIDEEAIIEFMMGNLHKRRAEVITELGYKEWERSTYSKFKILFLNYVVAQKAGLTERNVGCSPYNYINSEGYVDIEKINDYITMVKSKVENYEQLYDTYERKFNDWLNGDISKLVCGKYLLSAMEAYLKRKKRARFNDDSFRFYLVSKFDINKLDFLKIKILNIMEDNS